MVETEKTRGSRADAESEKELYLFKNVSSLRLTYQIRLLTFFAAQKKKTLVVRVPKHCQFHKELESFIRENKKHVKAERVG